MIEHPHSYIGFSHCLDCAKHSYDNDMSKLRDENQRLKQSMMQHFSEEHLAGDGPEIDRWKAQNRQLEQQNAELRSQLACHICGHQVMDICEVCNWNLSREG